MMNERGKSDPAVVAAKLANKAERSAAEPVEPRAGTKGNANQQHSGRTQSRETVSQVLARIRQTAVSDLPLLTRGRSRMRESRTYGSVRGAGSNLRPYRDRLGRCSKSAAIWGTSVATSKWLQRPLRQSGTIIVGPGFSHCGRSHGRALALCEGVSHQPISSGSAFLLERSKWLRGGQPDFGEIC